MAALDDAIANLKDKVAAHITVEHSLETLAAGLNQQLKDAIAAAAAAGATPAQLQVLNDMAATVEAETANLTAAVVANTPVAQA